jgi:molybdenum-dependent DNA-binding transcriptional regulator ModE
MVKSWNDMSPDQKLESTRTTIEGISARLDEVGAVVIELEKQIKQLQGMVMRQTGRPRPVLKLGRGG